MNCIRSEQDFSFPRYLRLTKPKQYQQVFAKPVRTTDKYFTVLAIRNKLDHPRLGLAIAKKNIKTAIGRNKVKRAVRESFRINQHHLVCIDIVVMARKDAADVPQHKLTCSLERHWLKLIDRCG